jgi:hypothetical protein
MPSPHASCAKREHPRALLCSSLHAHRLALPQCPPPRCLVAQSASTHAHCCVLPHTSIDVPCPMPSPNAAWLRKARAPTRTAVFCRTRPSTCLAPCPPPTLLGCAKREHPRALLCSSLHAHRRALPQCPPPTLLGCAKREHPRALLCSAAHAHRRRVLPHALPPRCLVAQSASTHAHCCVLPHTSIDVPCPMPTPTLLGVVSEAKAPNLPNVDVLVRVSLGLRKSQG